MAVGSWQLAVGRKDDPSLVIPAKGRGLSYFFFTHVSELSTQHSALSSIPLDCLLPTANCQLSSFSSSFANCPLPTAHFFLSHSPLPSTLSKMRPEGYSRQFHRHSRALLRIKKSRVLPVSMRRWFGSSCRYAR